MTCPACGGVVQEGMVQCPGCGHGLLAAAPFSKLLSPRPLRETTTNSVPGGGAVGGRYEIRGTLGEGPLAAVYRAFDREIEVEVAVKVMRKNLFLRDEDRAMFLAGCDAARRLSHPNLIRVFHADARGAYPFLAMQLIEGVTLRQVIERRREGGTPFTLAEVEPIVSQIATALDYLHQFVPAHALIKPENLVLVPDLLKLTDFNISTSLSMAALLIAETRGGAHGYIAPEVRGGSPLTAVADVYSTAIVVAELLIGSFPTDPDFRLKSVRPDIPAELEFLLKRCLASDPRTRVQRVSDLARGLRAFVQEPAVLRGTTRPAAAAVRQSLGAGPSTLPPMSLGALGSAGGDTENLAHRAPPPVPMPGPTFAAPGAAPPESFAAPVATGPVPVPLPSWSNTAGADAAADAALQDDDEKTQVSTPAAIAAEVGASAVPVAADVNGKPPSSAAGARRRAPIPLAVWIALIVGIVGGGAWAVIEFLDKLRADRETVERETERERAQLAQERARLETLRLDLETKTAAITRAATTARERATAAAQAAAADPGKRAEADRLAAEAKKMEVEAQRIDAERAKVKSSLKAVRKKLKKKDEPEEPDEPPAAQPAAPAAAPHAEPASPAVVAAVAPSPPPAAEPAPVAPSSPAPSPTATEPEAPAPKPAPARAEEEDASPSAAQPPPAPSPEPPPPAPPAVAPAPAPAPAVTSPAAPPAPEPPTPSPEASPAPGPAAPSTVFLREGMPAPERVEGRDPEYVQAAKEAGIAGTVVLLFKINPKGRVRDVRLVKSLPILGEACAAAVRRWQYAPYVVDGRPVTLITRRAFQFKLE